MHVPRPEAGALPGVPSIELEGYDVLEPIGAGGYSRVYRAWQHDVGRVVAVKVLAGSLVSEGDRQSFERECRAMGALSGHPNIVTVYKAAYTADGRPSLVMAYYASGTLGDRLRAEGPIPLDELLPIGIKVAGALATAHERGVIHRDIKPQNVFVSEFSEPALGDFGISTLLDERTLTGAGGGLTVHFAPPELIEGSAATPLSDVYSMAATFYALAAGRKPFPRGEGQTITDLARRILFEPPPRLGQEWGSVADLIEQAMAKDPSDRPASALVLAEGLRSAQTELGMSPTPIPVAARSVVASPGVGSPGVGSPGVGSPESPAVQIADRTGGAAHDRERSADVESTTIPRPGMRPSPPVVESEDEPVEEPRDRRGRRSLALGVAGVVAVAAVVVAGQWIGGDGEGPTEPAARPGVSTTDAYFAAPTRPREVTLVVRGTMAEASWVGADGAVSFQVHRTDLADVVVIETEGPTARWEVAAGERPCIEVLAVGADGKLSAPSERACG